MVRNKLVSVAYSYDFCSNSVANMLILKHTPLCNKNNIYFALIDIFSSYCFYIRGKTILCSGLRTNKRIEVFLLHSGAGQSDPTDDIALSVGA